MAHHEHPSKISAHAKDYPHPKALKRSANLRPAREAAVAEYIKVTAEGCGLRKPRPHVFGDADNRKLTGRLAAFRIVCGQPPFRIREQSDVRRPPRMVPR